MNRRFKVLILVLLTAVLCLSAAIANLAYSGSGSGQKPADTQTPAAGSSVTLFPGQNGLWGARTATGRVLIEPTWYYLRSMSDTVLIARRNDGTIDSFGLIRISGEQLVPFLYSNFEMKTPDFWIAALTENGSQKYHLYHADGTRWTDESWDSAELNNGVLTVTLGNSSYTGRVSPNSRRIEWTELHEEFDVSLYRLTLDVNETRLRNLPSAETLHLLGDAAADYLEYLFITREDPDTARIDTEHSSEIRAADRYEGCQLKGAQISRITACETEGYPEYLLQMQVQYRQLNAQGEAETVRTGMILRLRRDGTGDLVYAGFSDTRQRAIFGGTE